MSYRKVPFTSGEYFHIYNRGNSKQEIFLDDNDYERFVKLLYLSNTKRRVNFRDDIVDNKINAWDFDRGDKLVSIGAWVLMPNHFHIYMTPSPIPGIGESKESNITLFVRKLSVSYSKYFNKKYGRTGSLFEGRFKAVHVNDEVQAKYLFSYIHLNPLKLIQTDWKENGIKNKSEALDFLKNYKLSSYLDYKNINRKEKLILDRENFINYFPTVLDFDKEIFDWISKTE